MSQKLAGVTTIELILSIGIIAILFGIATPLLRSFFLRNDLDVAQNAIVQDLYRAQSLAATSEADSNWGVNIGAGQVTLFRGNSYAARNQAYDETFTTASSLTNTGTTEYVFTKFTGLPTAGGTVTITSSNNETRVLVINSKGMVEEQ